MHHCDNAQFRSLHWSEYSICVSSIVTDKITKNKIGTPNKQSLCMILHIIKNI